MIGEYKDVDVGVYLAGCKGELHMYPNSVLLIKNFVYIFNLEASIMVGQAQILDKKAYLCFG